MAMHAMLGQSSRSGASILCATVRLCRPAGNIWSFGSLQSIRSWYLRIRPGSVTARADGRYAEGGMGVGGGHWDGGVAAAGGAQDRTSL
jgi:hypothetical protein